MSIAGILPASVNANTGPDNPQNVNTILRSKIVKLLGKHTYYFKGNTLEAQVSVLLNNNNELVVIDVKTKDSNVDHFIKNKLNYKKVHILGIDKGVLFRIPLKMIAPN